jgi:hypothetical protein
MIVSFSSRVIRPSKAAARLSGEGAAAFPLRGAAAIGEPALAIIAIVTAAAQLRFIIFSCS